MTNTTGTIDRYIEFWNTTPGDEQRRLGEAVFTGDVGYHTPIGVRTGVDALVAFASEFVGHAGPVDFRLRSEPDVHHDRARVAWALDAKGAGLSAEGTDTLVLDDDGRIASITTFLDRAPDGFDPAHHEAGAEA